MPQPGVVGMRSSRAATAARRGGHAVVSCGGTGEFAYLSEAERRQIHQLIAKRVRGGARFVAQSSAVSTRDTIENAKFAEKFSFPFPLLSDSDRTIGMAYGACDSPKDEYARRIAYVIDEKGTIAQAHAKVDVKTYPQDQLATL